MTIFTNLYDFDNSSLYPSVMTNISPMIHKSKNNTRRQRRYLRRFSKLLGKNVVTIIFNKFYNHITCITSDGSTHFIAKGKFVPLYYQLPFPQTYIPSILKKVKPLPH